MRTCEYRNHALSIQKPLFLQGSHTNGRNFQETASTSKKKDMQKPLISATKHAQVLYPAKVP